MKNIKEIKLNKKKKSFGFSLLEVLISMFIFVLAVTASISVFAGIVSNKQIGRETQKNIEDTRVALDLMAKNMRMSTQLEGTDGLPGGIAPARKYKSIIMFNNSQGICVGYRFRTDGDDSYLEIGENTADSKGNCDINKISNFEKITEGNVSGFFSIIKTDKTIIGRATIALTVDDTNLETSVSFRDYDFNK